MSHLDGASYTLGNTKGEEWYLYTLDNQSEHTDKPDVTLEILMSELDQNKMKQFIKRSDDGKKVTEVQCLPLNGHSLRLAQPVI